MSTVVSRDGTEIAFSRSGNGPTLLLVDGGFGHRALGSSSKLAELLAPHFTVFTYDRRGRNESGDTTPYTVRREVEDIAALIEAAGGEAYVYGASSGAVLAFIAATELSSITKLALYDPAIRLDAGDNPIPLPFLAHLEELQAEGKREEMVAYFLEQSVGVPPEEIPAIRQSADWPALVAIAPTLVYETLVMGNFKSADDLAQAAKEIKVDVLVATGEKSPPNWQHAAKTISGQVAGAKLQTIDQQAHDVAPEVIAPLLIEFFQR